MLLCVKQHVVTNKLKGRSAFTFWVSIPTVLLRGVLDPEDKCTQIFTNISNSLLTNTAQHPRICDFQYTSASFMLVRTLLPRLS